MHLRIIGQGGPIRTSLLSGRHNPCRAPRSCMRFRRLARPCLGWPAPMVGLKFVGAHVRFLYRCGNASGPLDVRSPSEGRPTRRPGVDPNGAIAASGGASVWEHPDTRWRKASVLPAGSAYRPELKIWCDASPHWLIAPAHDMLLSRYVAALDTFSLGFVRVE